MSTAIFEPGPSVAAPGTVVTLESSAALDPAVVGAKAASLAKALRAGLPVLPGWVVTTDAFAPSADGNPAFPVDAELRAAWSEASDRGGRPVVVRSSSTVEDGQTSSMAGMFTSVLDVADWGSFRRAVDSVLASADIVSLAAPMAVLVQPQLVPTVGGVLFGVDPVSGRTDHVVVSASDAGPAAIVGGEVDGSRYVLARRRVVEGPAHGPLTAAQLRRLAVLAHQAERVFGGPQDVEWAFGPDGRLWLLQSRPVTTTAVLASLATGPTLGPGPVAETFPEPLSPLEEDLWLAPLRAGLRTALALAGTSPRRRLASSPVVTTVEGRVAADLDLLGAGDRPTSVLRRLDPRPPFRRLVAAWRVGRLRAALPSLAADLVAKVDADLLAVDAVDHLTDRQLAGLLERSAQGLAALHGHEVLMGWLVDAHAATSTTTAASVALRALAAGRADGLTDEEILRRHPSVLALTPPRVGSTVALPATVAGRSVQPPAPLDAPDQAAVLREALRLRARWLQELTARAAWEVGERLAARGGIAGAGEVRWMRLPELFAAVRTGVVPTDATRHTGSRQGPPLPARFRLTTGGAIAPAGRPRRHGRAAGGGNGTGAGGGRGSGRVHGGGGLPDQGAVLVVRTLDPDLAPLLPGLGGLVAETGSFLSHLAILAREFGVPTVVGVDDALARFPAGAMVVVDGTTGEVIRTDGQESGAA
ncbi:MAG: PEP/pyruvate-binding domain-containing protein [Acidimicrobiales bacterium]